MESMVYRDSGFRNTGANRQPNRFRVDLGHPGLPGVDGKTCRKRLLPAAESSIESYPRRSVSAV